MSAAVTPPHELERALLDEFQRNFPLVSRPYTAIAQRLGADEETVLAALEVLSAGGQVSRIGAIVAPHRAGWSTLVAMAVPPGRMSEVAALVNGFPEVNHNYEREHLLNLWFVVTGEDQAHVAAILDEISLRTGLKLIDLPLIESFRLDLGFPLQWS